MKRELIEPWNRVSRRLLLVLSAGALLSAPVQAQEVGALLDTMVEKKLLTPEEAERVRAGLSKENAQTAAGKLKLADSITELKLYGDIRLRYQYEQAHLQEPRKATLTAAGVSPSDAAVGAVPHVNQRSRERFRLRLGADLKIGSSFFGGFGLATGQIADSNNETFTGGFDNYNIYINKAFLGWKPTNWATLIAGKQENPLYTTELVWDADINPQGLVENVDITKALFPDGKKLAVSLIAGQFIFFDNDEFRRPHAAADDAWLFSQQLKGTYKFNSDVTATFAPGFNIYNAARVSGLRNGRAFSDATFANFTVPVQTQVLTTTTNQITLAYDAKGVPTLTTTPVNVQTVTTITDPSTGNVRTVTASTTAKQLQKREVGSPIDGLPKLGIGLNPNRANKSFVSTKADAKGTIVITAPQPTRSRETGDLAILTAPGDVSFNLFGRKAKVYWDLAYNTRGRERFDNVLGLDSPVVIATQDANNPVIVTTRRAFGQHYEDRDALAWLAGIQFGENKKRGNWSVLANYRETGIAAIDPNLNDSDFALSAVNIGGAKATLAYSLADWLVLSASYSHAWNLRKNLIGGQATSGASIADLSDVEVFQVDLNWKF